MNLTEITEKINEIKAKITQLTGNTNIDGELQFKECRIKFIIPPPFAPEVRLVANKLGISLTDKGLTFQSKSLSKLDDIVKKIEEFEVELSNYINIQQIASRSEPSTNAGTEVSSTSAQINNENTSGNGK